MSQKAPISDSAGSALLRMAEDLYGEIQHKITTAQSKIDMQCELKDQTIDAIKSAFEEVFATLKIRESELIVKTTQEVDESVKNQKRFLQESNGLVQSLRELKSEIIQMRSIEDNITVNAYNRRLEVLEEHFYKMSNKVFEPVFIRNVNEENFIRGLRIGQIQRQVCLEVNKDDELDGTDLTSKLNITGPETFPLHRPGADLKDSILSSFVWTHGRVVATDKPNRKLKVFTQDGKFLHEMIFSNAEPYCVALIDSENEVDHFAVTFPKAKYVYFINLANDNTPPWISFFMKTDIGYSGISRGPSPGIVFCTVVSNSGEPRLDVVDFRGKVLNTFKTDPYGHPLFSFPRYVHVNANTVFVSDHKMNAVMFLDFDGQLLGKYTGIEGQPLVNPFDITFDGDGNVLVLDGKTGHIHIIDNKLRLISIIKSGRSLLTARLLDYDSSTNRLAVTHGAGDLSIYLVKPDYTIEEFEMDEPAVTDDQAAGQLRPGKVSSSENRRSAGCEGLLQVPIDEHRAPSPGF